ncbi:MAG: tryptophan-rich sensory protein [Methanothrix sp.]|nr:tryptophan-rich sensory protein [Methanothrix sp.]
MSFLWLLILHCIIRFWYIRKDAALLLVPYIVWVSFAAFLNYTIWRLNL